jgi:L-rhamnose mutarotase
MSCTCHYEYKYRHNILNEALITYTNDIYILTYGIYQRFKTKHQFFPLCILPFFANISTDDENNVQTQN